MRLSTVIRLIALSLVSRVSLADVVINIPSNVELLVVNEEKPKIDGGFFSSTSTTTLDDGQHQVVLRVTQSFTGNNDKELFTSQPVIGTFNGTQAELSIEIPTFTTSRQAQAFNDQPRWHLVTSEGEVIKAKQDKLVHHGMQVGRDFISEIQAYNQGNGIAIWTRGMMTNTSEHQQSTPTTTEEMLHFWYKKADPETQQRFKEAINAL
ncbi:hypothetical protein ST37_02105 (plasmid) [Vibrio sp. qd031]|uniref:DUF2057 family protein n=1 Tax=Vibrio sp. qd031 TaxID=1603038 RepID=UPI000A1209CA|nr:DUF2057 family protein [Vibrio sp. qd031]ORT52577.1 hypothetical protein ST37_02105 [Vibrio sp. qd031]